MSNFIEIVLPAGVNAVEVRDIPGLLASAIHPQTESAAKVLSALKKQMLDPDGSPLPGLHPLTSNPLHDRITPEQRLLEAIFVAPPDEETTTRTDWALLNLAWEELPDFKLPLPESEWTKYADAWEKSTYQQADWRLVPEWDTESSHAYLLNMKAQAAHRTELAKAIKSGSIVPRSPVTRLPEPLADNEGLRTGFVLVEEFRRYAGRFEIGVTLAPDTQAPSATSVSTISEETARHIEYLCAREYPDYDAIKPERVGALRAMAMPGHSSGATSRGRTFTEDERRQILAQAESYKSDLRTKTADEIAGLVINFRIEDSQNWQTKAEQEHAVKELAAASKVDWDFWRAMRKATIWQACALSIPLDPDSLKPHPQGWMAGPGGDQVFESKSFPTREIKEKFDKRLRLLRANRYDRTIFTLPLARYSNLGPDEISLSEFAAWGLSIGWG